ncbi:hypothetical protein RHM66_22155 [Pseudomonas sp. RTB3]|nr:hypothetical protein RHM66_22155 [Pseudomonas sp. RTB3]
MGNWRRLELRGVNLDPNLGSSWTDANRPGDNQFGFTLANPQSPIVFLVGKGTATGVSVSGSSKTFLYAGGGTGTKYFCFDLMRDDGLSGPALKTRNETTGALTFLSRQRPLKVIASIRAPSPGATDAYGRPITTYVGGRNEKIAYQTQSGSSILHSVVDISLESGVEYAAFLPWNRSCGVIDSNTVEGGYTSTYGLAEGAFGRTGGISFFFAPPGRTTQQAWPSNSASFPYSFHSLPTDRFPSALVISAAGLPFPFN